MKLRTIGIISTLALALLAGPLPAEAQQADKLYRIGYLHPGNIAKSSGSRAFFQGLRDLGYVEGRNIIIERRSAKGRRDRLPELAAELVRLKVDVIVGTGAIGQAAIKATRTIPIVVTVASDYVARGWARSLRRPGSNVTGMSTLALGLIGKFVGGAGPCSNETFNGRKADFEASKHPFIYTPGDNDWTDCHSPKAGSHDPIERLAKLREVFFQGRMRLNSFMASTASFSPNPS